MRRVAPFASAARPAGPASARRGRVVAFASLAVTPGRSIRNAAAGACLLGLAAAAFAGCTAPLFSVSAIRSESLEGILARTERARGLRADAPVKARLISRRALPALIRREIRAMWTPAEFVRYEQSLVAVGLWPADLSLLDEYVAFGAGESAGLYAFHERTVYVVSDAPLLLLDRLRSALGRRDEAHEFVLAHELVHWLQHRAHPELIEWAEGQRGQDDAGYAVDAAIEGDALRYGFEALDDTGRLPDPDAFRWGFERESRGSDFARAPTLIRVTGVFPYVSGYRLAYFEGADLLQSPPASSEQALHAAKRYEPFLAIDLGDRPEELPAGCQLLYENTMGELGLSVLFRVAGEGDRPELWEGWDGDRYQVARCGGGLELLWLSSWDSQSDAQEFEQAYRALAAGLAARAELGSIPRVERTGREVVVWTRALDPIAGSLARTSRRARVSSLAELSAAFPSRLP
jgi:hypothetical protein